MFLRQDIICVIYVDDTIFFSKTNAPIEQVIEKLKENFELTDEGDVEAFLGITIPRNKDGTIKMSQPGLIDQVITTVQCIHLLQ